MLPSGILANGSMLPLLEHLIIGNNAQSGLGGAGTSPTIGEDGTIYCGYYKLKAINPDGSLKWEFNPGVDRSIRGGHLVIQRMEQSILAQ